MNELMRQQDRRLNSLDRHVRLRRRSFLAATSVAFAGLSWQTPIHADEIKQPGKTPNTRFAVNVEMWFGRRSFLEKIRAAADMGFPAIEFWPYENKPIDEAAKLLQDRKVAVAQFTAWGFGTELNHPEFDHAKFERKIAESCDVADRLNCSLFTVVVGNDIPGVSKQEMHAAAIRGLKRVAPICENRKKTIIIEPMNPRDHPKHCLYGSADAIEICKQVGSPSVKINWDLYHMQIVEGDLCMNLREGFDHVGYIQLADNPGRHEPGTGEVNYTRVFQEIKALGYPGFVGLECRPKEGDRIAAERIYRADSWN
jgi:hydroxypyruvate isomerase